MKPSEIDGQAVIEGIMIRSQSEYAIAVQREDGSVIVKKSSYHNLSDKSELLKLPFVRGIVHSIEMIYLEIRTLLYSYSFIVKQAEREKREWREWISTGTGRSFTDKKRKVQTPAVRRLKLVLAQAGMIFLLLCAFIFTIGLLVLSPMFLAEYLTGLEAFIGKPLLEGILRLLLFFIYLIVMHGGRHIRHMLMYHGAKHKVIHCIENGLPLIINNVRRQPRKHRRCDTGFLLLVICLSSVCFLFIRTEPLWQGVVLRLSLMPLIAAVSYEIAHFISESESKAAEVLSYPSIWLQELTTREPDDDRLQVTIQAAEAVFDWRAFLGEMGQPVSAVEMEKKIDTEELREEEEQLSLSMRTKERLIDSIHEDEVEYDRYKKNSLHEEQSAAAYEDALMEEPEDLEDDPILKALDRYFGN